MCFTVSCLLPVRWGLKLKSLIFSQNTWVFSRALKLFQNTWVLRICSWFLKKNCYVLWESFSKLTKYSIFNSLCAALAHLSFLWKCGNSRVKGYVENKAIQILFSGIWMANSSSVTSIFIYCRSGILRNHYQLQKLTLLIGVWFGMRAHFCQVFFKLGKYWDVGDNFWSQLTRTYRTALIWSLAVEGKGGEKSA